MAVLLEVLAEAVEAEASTLVHGSLEEKAELHVLVFGIKFKGVNSNGMAYYFS
jgi:hypothetical protein